MELQFYTVVRKKRNGNSEVNFRPAEHLQNALYYHAHLTLNVRHLSLVSPTRQYRKSYSSVRDGFV